MASVRGLPATCRSACHSEWRCTDAAELRPGARASMSITWGTAKSPTSAAMMWMPPSRWEVKVKRCTPCTPSYPMEEIHRPMQPAASPLTTESEAREAMTVTPSTAIQKRCEGPKPSAHCARTGVKKINTRTPSRPPTPEDRKLSCSACAARPCCTMRWPSSVVAMLAGAPGILSRMALTAPPATVAVYTDPSRISPPVGSMWKVKGMSRATAMVGLRPGNAPRIRPPAVPRSRIRKLKGLEDVAHVLQEIGARDAPPPGARSGRTHGPASGSENFASGRRPGDRRIAFTRRETEPQYPSSGRTTFSSRFPSRSRSRLRKTSSRVSGT